MEICRIAGTSIPEIFSECQVVTVPVADGGEGTVACFIEAIGAEPRSVCVSGPYGEPIEAVYAKSGSRAIIEMASAAGLPQVGENRNPETTTTYGVGQLIKDAIRDGATEILLGLGGSATNDGGCGCAAALGVRFFDTAGVSFIPTGATLKKIASIDVSPAQQTLSGITVTAMCDVTNPLYGPTGAAHVFGPQKGADEAMIQRLDNGLQHLDAVVSQSLGILAADMPGAGAAGGMGYACVAFLGGSLKSGIDAVLDMVDFDAMLEGADLVITGEGRIDFQSLDGKVISGIARRTSSKDIPLVAIVGSIHESAVRAYDLGITAMFGIDREAAGFRNSAEKSAENYRRTLKDVLRLIRAF